MTGINSRPLLIDDLAKIIIYRLALSNERLATVKACVAKLIRDGFFNPFDLIKPNSQELQNKIVDVVQKELEKINQEGNKYV